MKTIVILAVFAMDIGGYQYAFVEEGTSNTGRLRLPEQMSIGDTLYIDSTNHICGYVPKK